MTAPPNPIRPITIDKVREIIEGLKGRYVVPLDDDMARLAAVYTGMQYSNLPPEQEFPGFPIRLLDVLGNEVIIRAPLFPPGVIPCDWEDRAPFGHPRYVKPTTWNDLADDMAAEFRRAMEPTNRGRRFGKKYAVAQFLEKVIPLIFPDQKPSHGTIWQQLARPYKRRRPRKRIR
jgi:hypothetical protein